MADRAPGRVAPRLAAVIPAHGAARTLGPCLEALAQSSVLPAVVIVVDDASRDTTAEVAAAHGATVLRRPVQGGPSAARNSGWRACDHELVVFLDADTRIEPGALALLLAAVDAEPALRGANGQLAPSRGGPDPVSAFVNTALRYQLRQHGARVASAFTSLCLMRRETLHQLGGFDERAVSRYADDVATRFVLPPQSLAQVEAARVAHDKVVPLAGLLRHRANVGYHFVGSVAANRRALRGQPQSALLDLRYPLNTALAAATWALLPGALLGIPGCRLGLGLGSCAFILNNAAFLRFVAREDGPAAAALALPLTAAESHAYLLGVARGAVATLRTAGGSHGPADAPRAAAR